MTIRSVRFQDLRAVRALDRNIEARLIEPAPPNHPTTAAAFALASAWQDMSRTMHTFVLLHDRKINGFVQAEARKGKEAWDIVRLACQASSDSGREAWCSELIEHICQASANQGSLRAFARVADESMMVDILMKSAFRRYTGESTLLLPPLERANARPALRLPPGRARGLPLAVQRSLQGKNQDQHPDEPAEGLADSNWPLLALGDGPAPEAAMEDPGRPIEGASITIRPRRSSDTWPIFQLYCTITPQTVRHAEDRRPKSWDWPHHFLPRQVGRVLSAWVAPHQLVAERDGTILGWLNVSNTHRTGQGGMPYREIELLAHPQLGDEVVPFITAGLRAFGGGAHMATYCRVREYDDVTRRALERQGFMVVAEEALMVKHLAARMTERQLLIAALRAQGLGMDLSRYQKPGRQLIAVSAATAASSLAPQGMASQLPKETGRPGTAPERVTLTARSSSIHRHVPSRSNSASARSSALRKDDKKNA